MLQVAVASAQLSAIRMASDISGVLLITPINLPGSYSAAGVKYSAFHAICSNLQVD